MVRFSCIHVFRLLAVVVVVEVAVQRLLAGGEAADFATDSASLIDIVGKVKALVVRIVEVLDLVVGPRCVVFVGPPEHIEFNSAVMSGICKYGVERFCRIILDDRK